jgi:enamine deaminase RidA (YjgF/YER057c/UK114 family)
MLLGSYLAALNGLAVARAHLGSLDRVTRIVRLACQWPLREMSAINRKVQTTHRSCCKTYFGKDKGPSRLVSGVASLPLDAPVELEIIFEVAR